MRLSRRKLAAWSIAALAAFLALVGFGWESHDVSFQVETISNKCSFDEHPQQSIRAVGDSVLIVLPIQTPTPCYRVEGSHSIFGNNIVVDLSVSRREGTCGDCIGVTVARAAVSNLRPGSYNLQVNAPDRSIRTNVKVV